MSMIVAGEQISTGWNADLWVLTEDGSGSKTREFVRELDQVQLFVLAWLGLDANRVTAADWAEMVQDENGGHEHYPNWLIPLNIHQMERLLTDGRYLHETVDSNGTRFEIVIDLTDY